MKYQNTKTGFVFETPCTLKGEDWVMLNPSPIVKEKEDKPVRAKRTKKDD